jgi:hypothetical protein
MIPLTPCSGIFIIHHISADYKGGLSGGGGLTVSFTYVNPQLAPQPLYRVLPAPLAFKKRRHVLKEHPSGRTGLVHGKVINISDHIYVCVYILPA